MKTWNLIFTRFNLVMTYVCLGLAVFAFIMIVSDGNAFGWGLFMLAGAGAFYLAYRNQRWLLKLDQPEEQQVKTGDWT